MTSSHLVLPIIIVFLVLVSIVSFVVLMYAILKLEDRNFLDNYERYLKIKRKDKGE